MEKIAQMFGPDAGKAIKELKNLLFGGLCGGPRGENKGPTQGATQVPEEKDSEENPQDPQATKSFFPQPEEKTDLQRAEDLAKFAEIHAKLVGDPNFKQVAMFIDMFAPGLTPAMLEFFNSAVTAGYLILYGGSDFPENYKELFGRVRFTAFEFFEKLSFCLV